MKAQQALQVLDQATQPQQVGRLSRADYVAIDVALRVLADLVNKPESEAEMTDRG